MNPLLPRLRDDLVVRRTNNGSDVGFEVSLPGGATRSFTSRVFECVRALGNASDLAAWTAEVQRRHPEVTVTQLERLLTTLVDLGFAVAASSPADCRPVLQNAALHQSAPAAASQGFAETRAAGGPEDREQPGADGRRRPRRLNAEITQVTKIPVLPRPKAFADISMTRGSAPHIVILQRASTNAMAEVSERVAFILSRLGGQKTVQELLDDERISFEELKVVVRELTPRGFIEDPAGLVPDPPTRAAPPVAPVTVAVTAPPPAPSPTPTGTDSIPDEPPENTVMRMLNEAGHAVPASRIAGQRFDGSGPLRAAPRSAEGPMGSPAVVSGTSPPTPAPAVVPPVPAPAGSAASGAAAPRLDGPAREGDAYPSSSGASSDLPDGTVRPSPAASTEAGERNGDGAEAGDGAGVRAGDGAGAGDRDGAGDGDGATGTLDAPEARKRRLIRRLRAVTPPALMVLTVFVVSTQVRYPLRITSECEVRPVDRAGVRAPLDGLLAEVLVDEGQRVEKGAVLGRIGNADLRVAVVKSQSALERARAELKLLLEGSSAEELERARTRVNGLAREVELAQGRVSRTRALVKEGVAPRDDLDRAEGELASLQGQLSQARADWKLLEAGSRPEEQRRKEAEIRSLEAQLELDQRGLDATEMKTPMAGVLVTKKPRELVNSRVGAGDVVFEILEPLEMRADVFVPERDFDVLRVGLPLKVKVTAYPTTSFEGKITRIAQEVERRDIENVVRVEGVLQNKEGLLLPNMTGFAEVEAEERPLLDLAMRRVVRWFRVRFLI